MAAVVSGYTLPAGITTSAQVKALQQQVNANGANLAVDGVYGPLTQAAYLASVGGSASTPTTTAVYADPSFDSYYNSIKSSLTPQTVSYTMPDLSTLSSQIAAYLRPSYDQAIAARQEQTAQNRADIDADAASRGMGRSSWVSDVKARESKAEASDIADLESNYGAALAEAVLTQYNQHLSNKLQADLANAEIAAQYEQLAYDRAADMYNLIQSKSSSSSSSSGSGNDEDLVLTPTAFDWSAVTHLTISETISSLRSIAKEDGAAAAKEAFQGLLDNNKTKGTTAQINTLKQQMAGGAIR